MSRGAIENGNEDQFCRSSSVDYIAARWCMLPPHVRETIVTLVDAGLLETQNRNTWAEANEGGNDESPSVIA